MIASATAASKAEKKLAKQFGGYMALNAKAREGCAETIEKIHSAKRDLETFGMLKTLEEAGAPGRLERKREEVGVLERREADLQARYAELLDERGELSRGIEQVSFEVFFRSSELFAFYGIKDIASKNEADELLVQLEEDKLVLEAQAALEAQEGDGDEAGEEGAEAADGDVQMNGD